MALAAFIIIAIPGDSGPYPTEPGTATAADLALRVALDPYDMVRTAQDCYSSQCNLLDVAGAILPFATGGLGKLDDLSDAAKAASQSSILSSLRATDALLEGTFIPKSFEMTTEGASYWVHPNATKHMAEYLGRGPAGATQYASQLLMESFNSAVETATRQGIEYDKVIKVGGWELIFGAPREEGLLPVIYHALYNPN